MSPESIRLYALECMCLAQKAKEPGLRSLLLAMAHSWAELANTADQFQEVSELKLERTVAHVNTSANKPDRRQTDSIRPWLGNRIIDDEKGGVLFRRDFGLVGLERED
jgi:hypothetical protein